MSKIALAFLVLLGMSPAQEGRSKIFPQPLSQFLQERQEQKDKASKFSTPVISGVGNDGGVDLRNYLDFSVIEGGEKGWDQGECPTCNLWTQHACLSILAGVHFGAPKMYSIQWMLSGANALYGCSVCGTSAAKPLLADFYHSLGFFVPWSNTNAAFVDKRQSQNSKTPFATISTEPQDKFLRIREAMVVTEGIGQEKAIANIKHALSREIPLYISVGLSQEASRQFSSEWREGQEDVPILQDISKWDGKPLGDNVWSHAMCVVGYDDENWIVLNSWGANDARPRSTFKISQKQNYDIAFVSDHNKERVTIFAFYLYKIDWTKEDCKILAEMIKPAKLELTVKNNESVEFEWRVKGTGNVNSVLDFGDDSGENDQYIGTKTKLKHKFINKSKKKKACLVKLSVTDEDGNFETSRVMRVTVGG